MARVQISLSDDEKRRWQEQARREGMSLSAWMRWAAANHNASYRDGSPFHSLRDLLLQEEKVKQGVAAPFEPDWEDMKRLVIAPSVDMEREP